ncbi:MULTISPECIES: RagB/SusD family nutrient uptake outer membrane protein [unclassified Sphingobacterium]|uniref:RagB/SusD family nutrient uptake outer membrane protein n=1 Tax=unclassified Sphingobacterium TaxID=2609468 RepID=UPI00265D2B78|nr:MULTISPECIES: RagB/SusD family nutrient uptake outer membrane protein [unclassified Sphingobacterium]WKK59405.1 RagB/SusD family nutrient uptake outer membrane protein [Sphingobacterium sp. BN32]
MKALNSIITHFALAAALSMTASCSLDRFPETTFSDQEFWNTESDLKFAANRLYQQLEGFELDNRGDDNVNQTVNLISNGAWSIPSTSSDWSQPYEMIFTANNILIKGEKAGVAEGIKNRYFAEAKFFRAYAYFQLLQRYGDVPFLTKTLDFNSPELNMARTPKAEIAKQLYLDLDYAKDWLPTAKSIPAADYGRVSKSAAQALKARIGLFLGTYAKYHGGSDAQTHLQQAVDGASYVMGQGHQLFSDYAKLFNQEGEGPANSENILVKIYGVNASNVILAHNYSRDLENGRVAVTRNLIRQYLYTDGLPAYNERNELRPVRSTFYIAEGAEPSYNAVLDNRDPRLGLTVFRNGEQAYKGPWVPTTTLGARTAYATKKGFNIPDWQTSGSGTTDRILIRYAEVLLTYAEAKYELNGSISDDDLDKSINLLRKRVGMNVKLSNAFAAANQLSMLEEIRRERNVELALEGFRYPDLIRWKLAENALTQNILGAKYNATDWVGADIKNLNLNADQILIVEDKSTRRFNPAKDYLYPVPLNEISLSGGAVVQNPNWK